LREQIWCYSTFDACGSGDGAISVLLLKVVKDFHTLSIIESIPLYPIKYKDSSIILLSFSCGEHNVLCHDVVNYVFACHSVV
jgi:hypothetical protein